ncbi:Protein kinase domain-containing protein [Neorhodopirellula lusitana]|uniref:Protein kinase domain-containing protein n=1 Tax=Neorhodopirellula lusitana TaxID=445327 RepID=A0ABY1PWS1_9BACT|nr:protein kinase family protein [Neorhodopirellula lusitana]SMP50928.1 Protein kinase domain-containing protein [Neorhodopirellula lusitana]
MFDRPRDLTDSILGIWRLGELLAVGNGTVLYTAQPADSQGNPRFDYVLKTVDAGHENPTRVREAGRQISQSIQASGVTHPNLVAVLDASMSDHAPYLVMPRLDAQPLNVRIASIEHFAVPVALWWARQIAQSLEKLHSAGWVHGDVKPDNILVDATGHVTLIDLGFASRIHTPMHRIFRGTPAYASPELTSGATAALPAMDTFALGRILWESLAATNATSSASIEPIAELIEQMVSPDPLDRPDSKRVVKQLLSLEIETLGGHIGPSTAVRRAA